VQRIFAQLVTVLFLVCGAAGNAAANAQGGETDAATFVRLTRALEADPMQDTTKEIRGWMMGWATETKDVSVKICLVMDLIPNKDESHSAILMLQSLFGNAAYQIEHPDKKADQLAQQVAGVESMLKAYSSLLRAHPEKHYAFLDMLLMRRDTGQLASYLAPQVAAKCSPASARE
jgi:hypothetical protein